MTKWTEPKGPPPSWLDEADEVIANDPKMPRDRFVVYCMNALLKLGCNVWQAASVTGNAINETGGGKFYKGNNLYGWKIGKAYAESYRKKHGKGPAWWRAPGNKAPGATLDDHKKGDPPWCFYRAFDSIDSSLSAWLEHFVPKPDDHAPYPGYRNCGTTFWAGGKWFPMLIKVGYKGARTKANPQDSIEEHEKLCKESLTRWAQSKLGCKPDGVWGPISRKTCFLWQAQHGLPTTAEADHVTLEALARA